MPKFSMFKPPNKPKKILISGAGIAGLGLARQLKKMKIPFMIIEKAKGAGALPPGAGIAFPPNAVQALRHIDLGSEIDRHTHQVEKIIYTDTTGTILSEASLLEPPLNADKFVAIHRHKFHKILRNGIEENIVFNTQIDQLHQTNDGVIVKFNNPNLQQEKFAAVIGADGINSRVRELVSTDNTLVDHGVTTWRWTCEYPPNNLNLQPTYMLGARDVFMAYPIGKACDLALMSLDNDRELSTIEEGILSEAKLLNRPILVRKGNEFFIYGDKNDENENENENEEWKFRKIIPKNIDLNVLPFDKKIIHRHDIRFTQSLINIIKEGHAFGKDEVYCYVHSFDPENLNSKNPNNKAILSKILEQYGGIAKEMLQILPDNQYIIRGRLRSVSRPVFVSGRVVVIGDGGHACTPMLQQGAASALEDVIVLSELIKYFPIEDALPMYEKFRSERVNWIISSSDGPMKMLIGIDSQVLSIIYQKIRENGPLNVQGWRKLLCRNPINEITNYIKAHQYFNEREGVSMTAKL